MLLDVGARAVGVAVGLEAGVHGAALGAALGCFAWLPWIDRIQWRGAGEEVLASARRCSSLLLGGLGSAVLVPGWAAVVALTGVRGAGAVIAAGLLSRAPLMLATPAQALMVPALTGRGAESAQRAARGVLLVTLLVAVVASMLFWLAGGWALQLLYGAEFRLTGAQALGLGVAAGGMLVMTSAGGVLVWRDLQQWVGAGWALAALISVTLLGAAPSLETVAWGSAVGSMAGALLMGSLAWSASSAQAHPLELERSATELGAGSTAQA